MVEILLMDWLEEFNSLSESEIRSYATEQEHNNEVVIALYTVFDEHVKYLHVSCSFFYQSCHLHLLLLFILFDLGSSW